MFLFLPRFRTVAVGLFLLVFSLVFSLAGCRRTEVLSFLPLDRAGGWHNITGQINERFPNNRRVLMYVPPLAVERGNAPVIVIFHGSNATPERLINEAGGRAFFERFGLQIGSPEFISQGHQATPPILIFPLARDHMAPDWDHESSERFWDTTHQTLQANEDLALVQNILDQLSNINATLSSTHVSDRPLVDLENVHFMGHSNGGFFALLAANLFSHRVAGLAVNAAGYVECLFNGHKVRVDHERFRLAQSCNDVRSLAALMDGSEYTCGAPDASGRTSPTRPTTPIQDRFRVPTFIAHANDDRVVSPYYGCALDQELERRQVPHEMQLRQRVGGHFVDSTFFREAWWYLQAQRSAAANRVGR